MCIRDSLYGGDDLLQRFLVEQSLHIRDILHILGNGCFDDIAAAPSLQKVFVHVFGKSHPLITISQFFFEVDEFFVSQLLNQSGNKCRRYVISFCQVFTI